MKTTLLTFAIVSLLSVPAFAADKLIKTCETQFSMPGDSKSIDSKIEIFQKSGNQYYARVTHFNDGHASSFEQKATVTEEKVCEGLTGVMDDSIKELNLAEKLVSHAMSLEYDEIFEGALKSGVDLKKVRSAKVFNFTSKDDNIGMSVIVEAKDKKGKTLGSFVGGMLLTPCK
jgi:hypothetical protein